MNKSEYHANMIFTVPHDMTRISIKVILSGKARRFWLTFPRDWLCTALDGVRNGKVFFGLEWGCRLAGGNKVGVGLDLVISGPKILLLVHLGP